MKPYIYYILFLFSFAFSFNVNAQIKVPLPSPDDLLINHDSIPFKLTINNIRSVPFEKAFEAFNNNQFEKAIKYYNSILEIEPEEFNVIYNRGLCYYKMREVNLSCVDFKYSAYLGNPNALNNYKLFCDSSSYTFSFRDSGFVYYKSTKSQDNNKVFPDSLPEFPGGLDTLYSFIINNLGSDFFRGFIAINNERVLLKFTINEDGSLSHSSFMNQYTSYKKEIIKVFSSMPKWKPAYKNGVPVKCDYLFPFINGSAFIKESNKIYNKGVVLLNESKLEESISNFNLALIFSERDYEAFYNRGVCYYKMKDLTNACLDWGKSYLINEKSQSVINKFCDSTILYNGEITKITSLNLNPSNASLTLSNDGTFTIVEEMPVFPGGESNLFMFLSNVKYPSKARENGISGRVYVTFVIDKNGNVRDPKVLRGIGGGCDEEAL